jgi:transcriptional regulator with XRE-family HTH domain
MSFGSRKETVQNIVANKEYRDFYTESYLKKSIPFQLRTMRTERDWSQIKAGEILGKGQNAISRLESPAYGKLTVQTLLEIAKGYDVGLIIKFVPYSRLLKEYDDVSFDALSAPSPTSQFKDELKALSDWADEDEDGGFWEEGAEHSEPAKASSSILDDYLDEPEVVSFNESATQGNIEIKLEGNRVVVERTGKKATSTHNFVSVNSSDIVSAI